MNQTRLILFQVALLRFLLYRLLKCFILDRRLRQRRFR